MPRLSLLGYLPMQDEAVAPAFAAAQKARALAAKASPRDQALIAAVAARYAEDPKADRKPLDAAYAGAMGQVAAEFPEDNEIAVLYAESVMDLSPWNYWQPGGREPNPQSVAIVAWAIPPLSPRAPRRGARGGGARC